MFESTHGTEMARVAAGKLRLWVVGAAAGAVAGAALGVRPAMAVPRHALRIAYRAPATCPGRGAFEEAVLRRLSAVKHREVQESLDVRIETVDGKFRGRLRFPESSDASLTREIWSDDCTELVRALGLVGAMLIDPTAVNQPDAREKPSAASQSEPPSLASEGDPASPVALAAGLPRETDSFRAGDAGRREGDAIAAARREGDAIAAARRDPSNARGQPERRHTREWRAIPKTKGPRSAQESPGDPPRPWIGHLALGGAGQTGIAPRLALGPRLSLDLGRKPSAGTLSYLGRVSLAGAWSARVPGTVGDAQFSWLSSRLELCGATAAGSHYVVSPCALAEIGTYRAEGHRAKKPQSESALWLTVGTSLRGEMTLAGPFSFYGEGAVTAPLRRPHFFFARSAEAGGEEEVHRVPGATFSAGIGISVRFL